MNQYGPGHDEEIEEYGTRCKKCHTIIWDSAPDDREICLRCWKKVKHEK